MLSNQMRWMRSTARVERGDSPAIYSRSTKYSFETGAVVTLTTSVATESFAIAFLLFTLSPYSFIFE